MLQLLSTYSLCTTREETSTLPFCHINFLPSLGRHAGEKTRGEEFQANINLREDAQRSWLHGFLSNIPSYPAIPHRRFLERRPLERGSQRAEVVKRLLLGPQVYPEASSISHRRVLAGSSSTHCLYTPEDRFRLTFRIAARQLFLPHVYPWQKQREIGYISPTGKKNHDDDVIVTGKWDYKAQSSISIYASASNASPRINILFSIDL